MIVKNTPVATMRTQAPLHRRWRGALLGPNHRRRAPGTLLRAYREVCAVGRSYGASGG